MEVGGFPAKPAAAAARLPCPLLPSLHRSLSGEVQYLGPELFFFLPDLSDVVVGR